MSSDHYIEVDGITIYFPCAPYSVQEVFMRKVIECLQKGVNGLLESPTGTGKTLSLLCSTLSWLKNRRLLFEHGAFLQANFGNGNPAYNGEPFKPERSTGNTWAASNTVFLPRIIYSSRTHSQLSQVVQELKRTAYKDVSSVVLGSRDQLCLHPEVCKLQSNAAKLTSCKHKVSTRTCPFFFNYENKLTSKDYQDNTVLDIEDLVSAGRKNTCCPYYAAKALKSKADIIFTPYNYLLDPKSRSAHGIEITGNVIIFDEAHNIESICEDSMSFQLCSADLARCINEVTQAVENIKGSECNEFSAEVPDDREFTLSDLSLLKVMFCELEEQLDKVVNGLKEGCAKPGSFMFEMLTSVGLTTQKKDVVLDLLDKVVLHLTTTESNVWTSKGAGLQSFSDMVKILFSKSSTLDHLSLIKTFNEKYRVYLEPDNSKRNMQTFATLTKKPGWILNYWCFSAEISMTDLVQQGVHSLILTSGTLSPLNSFAAELGIPFPVQLENPHIIDNSQVFVAVITQGPDGTALNSSYQNRSNVQYINSLGRTLINLGRRVPDGMLVFFPSYSVLHSTVAQWEDSGIWNSLSAVKSILREPQGKIAFQESISQYYNKIENPDSQGAVLLAVCRGKVSEGLDFSDKNARAVFITGLPFPPSQDPRVKLKISYLNEFCKKKGFSGNDWYLLQASRAVNQAVGRVIRHSNDYGAIIFCDNRFSQKRIYSQLSTWLQGRINIYNSFGPALKDLSNFFRIIEKKPIHQSSNQTAFSSVGNITLKPSNEKKSNRLSCNNEAEHKSSGDDNIIQSYMSTPALKTNVTNNLKPTSSIFDAMDAHKDSLSPKFPSHTELVISEKDNKNTAQILDVATSSKRRKINVPLQDITGKEKVEPNGDNYILIQQTWKQHLSEIKMALGFSSDYSKFCECVKAYKSDNNVIQFAKDISKLFYNIPKSDYCVNIASRLVSSDHRTEFLNQCSKFHNNPNDVTNNLKPTSSIFDAMDAHKDSLSPKFPSHTELVISEKDNKNNAQILDVATSSKTRKINVPHDITGKEKIETNSDNYILIQQTWKQHLSEVKTALGFSSDYSKFRECVKVYKSDKNVTQFAKDISKLFYNIPKSDYYVNIASRLVSSDHRTEFLNQCSKFHNNPNGESSTSLITEDISVNNDQQVSDQNLHKKSSLFSGEAYQCAKCQQIAKVPMMAPCSHVCCCLCWREILRKSRCCPICDKPVKMHNLCQKYFKSAGSIC